MSHILFLMNYVLGPPRLLWLHTPGIAEWYQHLTRAESILALVSYQFLGACDTSAATAAPAPQLA